MAWRGSGVRIPLAPQNRTSLLPGGAFLVFSSLYPQARILGIDSSPDMIASARKLCPDCDFDVLDAGSLDELDTDFDVVFSNACLQWVPNHERVLPSMLRRLNVGAIHREHQPAAAHHHARDRVRAEMAAVDQRDTPLLQFRRRQFRRKRIL
ncbi:MAG: methyltransferase domain-containing protein [Bifidobacterium bifidum]|nr:methyltransferase domain-containing protein [Bifidobacterium bifidum]